MKIEIPTACPECMGAVETVNDQLFCTNPTCSAKTSKNVLHFIKTMKIMGLGEKTVEKLELFTIFDIYTIDKRTAVSKLGEKVGTKIINEINKSKVTSIQKFITALGIPLIGKTAAEKIQNTVRNIEDITAETCKRAGLGAKASFNLVSWFVDNWLVYSSLPLTFLDSEPVISGLLVCISGKVPGYTKAKLKDMLLDYNVTVKDSVTKDLDYLITNEAGTTKVKKAEQYNISIISFELFMEKVKK